MENIKFGIREVIASVTATLLYLLTFCLSYNLTYNGIIAPETADWFPIHIFVVTFTTAVFGPICGGICVIGGMALSGIILYGKFRMIDTLVLLLFSYLIGRYSSRFGVLEGRFNGIAVADYAAIEIVANVACWIFVAPLLHFLIDGDNLIYLLTEGLKSAFSSITVSGVILNIIMYVISRIINRGSPLPINSGRGH